MYRITKMEAGVVSLIDRILQAATIISAPFILLVFTMISAYVLKFRLPKGGLGFDYIVFAVVILVALVLGGAI